MRSFLIAVGVLVACSNPRSAPPVLAESDERPDAGAPTAFDGGTIDGGSSDAGDDAGTADAGAEAGRAATIDCAPFGAAKLAWTLTGYQNPSNLYDSNAYAASATDTLDGLLVGHGVSQGHEFGVSDATYGPDGRLRVASLGGYDCGPMQGCVYNQEVLSNGRIYTSNGGALSAQDGHVIYWFDPAPAGADAGSIRVQDRVAANGGIAVFIWNYYPLQAPAASNVTLLDVDGGTVWQHTFSQGVEAAAVDDTGITLLRMANAGDLVAFAPDGGVLYSQTPDANLRHLLAAGGRFSLGGSTLYNVADGSPVSTLRTAPRGTLLLTASRIYLWNYDTSTGRSTIDAVDPATGETLWQQPVQANNGLTYVQFSVTGERAVIIDPQDVLHVLQDDGTDLLACKVAPGVGRPVLLQGGRLAVQRYPNLEVYDLPY